MLTLAYLIVETWKALWRPRATVVRKSSFRTLQKTERPVVTKRPPPSTELSDDTPQPIQRPSSWREDLTPEPQSPNSPKSPRQQQQQQQQQQPLLLQRQDQSNLSSPGDDRKVLGRGIPVASKHIVASTARQTQSSSIQPQTAQSNQATAPPQSTTSPVHQQHQQQQQQQQQQSTTQPSQIPTPIQKSVKTLVLTPSISGNRMDETWAKTQLEKFSFGFDEADKDKSGSLSFDEVLSILQKNGFNGSRTEAQFIFGHMDADGSKSVSKDEFNKAMGKVPRMIIREYVYRKAFKQMDKDNSGCLTKTEIMDATKNEGGIEIGAKVVSDLLCYISKDEGERVDYEEFLRVFGIEATAAVLYTTFKAIDKDGSGFLTRTEMMDAVSNECELKMSAQLISQLLIDLVKDDDQKMNFDEFIKSYLKQKERK